MSYFKSNFYDAVKLFLAQFAMAVYGLVTSMATINSPVLMLGSSILGVVLYIFIIYDFIWEIGGRDKIRQDVAHAKINYAKPFWIALLANVPNFVFSILVIIGHFVGENTLFTISNAALRMLQAMYLGIFKTIELNGLDLNQNPFTYTITPFISVFVTFIMYVLGTKNIALLPEKKRDNNK